MVFGLVAALITWSTPSTEPSKRAPATVTHLRDAGNVDQVTYDERWGGVRVDMAGPVISRRAELEALGWEVRVLEGLDHLQAMQAAQVLPILRPLASQ